MAAADGEATALQTLADLLSSPAAPETVGDWPEAVRETWETGLELTIDSWERNALSAEQTAFLLACGRSGLDLLVLRDVLAVCARKEFSHYPDPAGLLQALGTHSTDAPIRQVCQRWRAFSVLREGIHCVDAAHGPGKVAEIDGLANEVHVRFDRRRQFTLPVFLDGFALVVPGSFLEGLLSGSETWPKNITATEWHARLAEGLVAASLPLADAAGALLAPGVVDKKTLRALSPGAHGKATGRTDAPDTTRTAPERPWHQARTVAELVELLKACDREEIEPPDDTSSVNDILERAVPRRDQAEDVCHAVSWLWKLAPDAPWLREMLGAGVSSSVCWEDRELFVQLTDSVPGHLVSAWLEASCCAKGPTFLAHACMALPLRLWASVEQALKGAEGADGLLLRTVVGQITFGEASADVLLWLWKSKNPERSLLANPLLLFRTLEQPVKGAFIRANRDMRKLLMENSAFQSLIMADGDRQAIERLVSCVKHRPLLDSGERQSLLVKIVRLFPHARELVEEKRQPARKAVGRITSARSYELRRRELEDIIKRRIPANSKAIAHARSYGDLRENAEYKAAKEEQAYLGARRTELEDDLHETRATDFGDVLVGDTVIPGSSVGLDLADGSRQTYHVLGLWDSIPEKNFVSYDTPVGRLLLGASVGMELTLPSGQEATVASIDELPAEVKEWLADVDSESAP